MQNIKYTLMRKQRETDGLMKNKCQDKPTWNNLTWENKMHNKKSLHSGSNSIFANMLLQYVMFYLPICLSVCLSVCLQLYTLLQLYTVLQLYIHMFYIN